MGEHYTVRHAGRIPSTTLRARRQCHFRVNPHFEWYSSGSVRPACQARDKLMHDPAESLLRRWVGLPLDAQRTRLDVTTFGH